MRSAERRQAMRWALITVAMTLALFFLRGRLEKTHVALAYLLLVLAGSAQAGQRVGLALSAVTFLLFDWFFLPPYGTLTVSNPLDWMILASFLVVSVVAARLLHRLQVEAKTARLRAAEVDRFASLGADTLSVARADQALATIAEAMRGTLNLTECRIHPVDIPAADAGLDSLARWVAEHGRVALRQVDHTTRLTDAEFLSASPADAVGVLLPLRVRNRTVGVLELTRVEGISLDADQLRFLAALGHYAALAVERMRLEVEASRSDALREADRFKTALLASVSHDLRTPLTTIKALAHDIGRGDDRARVIEEEADRLNRMVADLLDMSRLQTGFVRSAIELNAVDDLVGAVVQRVSGFLGERTLVVHLEDGGTLMIGRFDLSASLRILVNLIENACKYSIAPAPIELGAVRRGDWIEVSVADQGIGIAPDMRERVFEPFVRATTAPADAGGAGLGLAIARGLAEAQGGALQHTPRHGGGSVFTLQLPAADLPEAISTA